ncbi:tRNA (N(6)-L-threonylcarbamoyladenosine(37)-C(2))-methylthiotransferase MtaB [Bacteroidia bacterium]|nr:tRNA (N(6)-L-threonylcarbamoyladenosine(37)-C(2))-methylthiotransferase MtaB [Bacteroidia bacterium]
MDFTNLRAAYITLGCKLNYSETSTIRRSLEDKGVATVDEKEEADIFIINTCSVTDVAERKGRQLLRKIVKHHPDAFVVVVGCYAQLHAKELVEMEGVDLVLGAKDKFKVAQYLEEIDKQPTHDVIGGTIGAAIQSRQPHSCDVFSLSDFDLSCSFGDRTRSFLKIQDGCDYFCSYCTIPFARGRSRSATIRQVLDAAKEIVRRDVKEIILTGVNTGDFGRNSSETFLDLLRALDDIEEVARIRISSIEPNLLTDDIISFVAKSERFMPHFHIPLQSGSNKVLKLMKRRYTRELFTDKITTINAVCPDAFIGVDIIAGMRGETTSCFDDSLHLVENLTISQLHVFPYSERQGTEALEIKGVVSQAEKHRRVEVLRSISESKLKSFYQRFEGQTRHVLFEGTSESSKQKQATISGFTDNYIRVTVPYSLELTNHIVPVLLTKECTS